MASRLKSGKKQFINPHIMTLFSKEQKTPSKAYEENYQRMFGKETYSRNLIQKKKIKLIFGKLDCPDCIALKSKYNKENIKYKFYDLDTPEGLAECMSRDLFGECNEEIPVIIEDYE